MRLCCGRVVSVRKECVRPADVRAAPTLLRRPPPAQTRFHVESWSGADSDMAETVALRRRGCFAFIALPLPAIEAKAVAHIGLRLEAWGGPGDPPVLVAVAVGVGLGSGREEAHRPSKSSSHRVVVFSSLSLQR